MDRRWFLQLSCAAVVAQLPGSDSGETPKRETDRVEPKAQSQNPSACGMCGMKAIFDTYLDINVCLHCGAHETAIGWQR